MNPNAKRFPVKHEIPEDTILSKIHLMRGRKVMLDSDLATLYEVSTGALLQAVKRNIERFPDDFMQLMTRQEFRALISQNVIPKTGRGGRRTQPFVFTEQGVAMLSSILKSRRAIQVNIQIMRTFSKLKHILEAHKDLKKKIEEMERKYDGNFKIVFDALRELLTPPTPSPRPKGPIGFQP
jgi:hypothetical protein